MLQVGQQQGHTDPSGGLDSRPLMFHLNINDMFGCFVLDVSELVTPRSGCFPTAVDTVAVLIKLLKINLPVR